MRQQYEIRHADEEEQQHVDHTVQPAHPHPGNPQHGLVVVILIRPIVQDQQPAGNILHGGHHDHDQGRDQQPRLDEQHRVDDHSRANHAVGYGPDGAGRGVGRLRLHGLEQRDLVDLLLGGEVRGVLDGGDFGVEVQLGLVGRVHPAYMYIAIITVSICMFLCADGDWEGLKRRVGVDAKPIDGRRGVEWHAMRVLVWGWSGW